MSRNKRTLAAANRVLVKLRPSNALRAAESRANLRPLYETSPAKATTFGAMSEPQWYLAELPDGGATPWDLAHARVADQLGVSESDVVFAEPDIIHDIFVDGSEAGSGRGLGAAGEDCRDICQDSKNGKAPGPNKFAWHLDDDYTQLATARDEVNFTDPLTRIAHVDTGYYRRHETVPLKIRPTLGRDFVDSDDDPSVDADSLGLLPDNTSHGTGTISILAGGPVAAAGGVRLGGAPDAEVVPLRVAKSVVLLRTSALAQALDYAVETLCDVLTMSMGGLPSQAWAEAVDKAYEAGLCICAAAGNHVGPTPPRVVVYPARYPRVIAVCGVMANHKPYADLDGFTLEGSFGPKSAMRKAIAAYTPNIPWAVFGCPTSVRRNGEGTSSATPQVAAAAALWFEKYKMELPRDWRRVEAVRFALFSSAKLKSDDEHFGNGVLQAHSALGVKPFLDRKKSDKSSHALAFLRMFTGLGIVEIPPREKMFNLELAQRWLLNEELQKIVPDPTDETKLEGRPLRQFMQAVIEDEGASLALRKQVAARYPVIAGEAAPHTKRSERVVPDVLKACDAQPALADPPHRRIRVYAVDPSLSGRLDTAGMNEVTLKIRWEELEKGPVGEYLAVEDVDAAKEPHKPVDLDDPRLLARDGWAPSEGNPQFHQQMVYAVAMKTIEHFERALGRPVLWRPQPNKRNDDKKFVRRLLVRPHALRQANAFYSPQEVALLFGYFEAGADDPATHMPGSRVYSCLSHDIIAHETTHAILDGMYRRFNEPTNLDVLALHEGFADIVALMQHFTIPELLEQEIARTRGNIEGAESMLGSLAVQFGQATGGRGALRNAIGRLEDGVWKRFEPDPADLQNRVTPHARGAVLVAAVFDAFIAIYNTRVADLLRIYTGGTGVLPSGAIHPDLVKRLADEAAKSASHVLNMCIRAVDYLPPVDVTFFEYLRALITADFDLVADDRYRYRVAFVEAFRRRGIYPLTLDAGNPDTPRTLSSDTLRWRGIDLSELSKAKQKALVEQYDGVIEGLKRYADDCLYLDDRKALFDKTRAQRIELHHQLEAAFKAVPDFAKELGLDLDAKLGFEVHELRAAMRVNPDGRHIPQVVVALTQSRQVPENKSSGTPSHRFRGGSTLVVDLSRSEVKYCIVKNIKSVTRQARTSAFVREATADPLRALFFAPERREPFAALHTLADDGF